MQRKIVFLAFVVFCLWACVSPCAHSQYFLSGPVRLQVDHRVDDQGGIWLDFQLTNISGKTISTREHYFPWSDYIFGGAIYKIDITDADPSAPEVHDLYYSIYPNRIDVSIKPQQTLTGTRQMIFVPEKIVFEHNLKVTWHWKPKLFDEEQNLLSVPNLEGSFLVPRKNKPQGVQ